MKHINLLPWQEIYNVKNKKLFYQKWFGCLLILVIILMSTHEYFTCMIHKDAYFINADQKKLNIYSARAKSIKEKNKRQNQLASTVDILKLAQQNDIIFMSTMDKIGGVAGLHLVFSEIISKSSHLILSGMTSSTAELTQFMTALNSVIPSHVNHLKRSSHSMLWHFNIEAQQHVHNLFEVSQQ